MKLFLWFARVHGRNTPDLFGLSFSKSWRELEKMRWNEKLIVPAQSSSQESDAQLMTFCDNLIPTI